MVYSERNPTKGTEMTYEKKQLIRLGISAAISVGGVLLTRSINRREAAKRKEILAENERLMAERNEILETTIADMDRRILNGKFWLQVTEPSPDE
jgi:hypothetical protein